MSIDWFRKPTADDPGTLNACYLALDRHVIRGRADEVAATLEGRPWTFADLLGEVGAFAGALRAFGVGPGDPVVVGPLEPFAEVVAALAVARLGAVRWVTGASVEDVRRVVTEASPRVVVLATSPDPRLDLDEAPVITADDTSELSWEVVMRAGRTDPAPCAEVAPDAVFAVLDGQPISVLAAVDGSAEAQFEAGGLRLWAAGAD